MIALEKVTNQIFQYRANTFLIKTFYRDIGIIPPDYDASNPGIKLPEYYESEVFELYLIKLLLSSKSLRKILDEKLSECHAAIDWKNAENRSSKLKINCQLKYNTEDMYNLSKTWLRTTENILTNLRKEFSCEKIDVLQMIWVEVKQNVENKLQENLANKREQIAITFDEQNHCLWVVGLQTETKLVTAKLMVILNNIEQQYSIKKNTVTEQMQNLKPHHIKLLVKTNFLKQIEEKSGVQIFVEKMYCSLTITGLPNCIFEAKNAIINEILLCKQRTLPCSKHLLALISKDDETNCHLERFLKEDIQNSELKGALLTTAVWEVSKDCVTIFARNEESARLAYDNFCANIISQTVPITEQPIRDLLKIEDWVQPSKITYIEKDVSIAYNKEYSSFAVYGLQCTILLEIKFTDTREYEFLTFHGIKTFALHAAEMVRTYVEMKGNFINFIHLPHSLTKFLNLYGFQLLDNVMKKFQQYNLQLRAIDDNDKKGVLATGGKYACCIQAENALLNEISENQNVAYFSSEDIHELKFLLSKAGQLYLLNLESKNKVVIDVYDKNYEEEKEKRNIFCLVQQKDNNLEIAAIHYDITSLKVDVIVNASNEELKLGSGVSEAIKNRGKLATNALMNLTRPSIIIE